MNDRIQIISYLHPKYYRLFIADCFASISSKSKKAEDIITKRLDNGIEIKAEVPSKEGDILP